MKIRKGPAKRLGAEKTIFDAPIGTESVDAEKENTVTLTICAEDFYSPKSTFRYRMTLSREEVYLLARSASL